MLDYHDISSNRMKKARPVMALKIDKHGITDLSFSYHALFKHIVDELPFFLKWRKFKNSFRKVQSFSPYRVFFSKSSLAPLV